MARLTNIIYKILRKFEPLLKTDLVYLSKGAFWLGLSQGVSSLGSFGLAIAFANWLDPETYGIYKYILSLAAMLAIPTLSGIETATVRAVAKGMDATIYAGLAAKLRWGLLASLAAVATGFYYQFFEHNIQIATGLYLFAVIVSPLEGFRLYQAYLSGKKLFKNLSLYLVTTKIITAVILFVAVYLTDNLLLILAAYFIPVVIIRVFYYFWTLRMFPPQQDADTKAVRYGKLLTLNSIITTIADQIDKVLLFNMLGPVQLAIFYFAIAPLEHAKALLKHIQALALPKFSNRSLQEIQQTLFGRVAWYMLFLALIVIIYIPAAPLLYRFIFPQYLSAVSYSQVFSLSLIAAPVLWVLNSVFESQGMIKQIYTLKFLHSIIQIGTTVVLIIYFGIWGAIVSRIIHRFISLILSGLFIKLSKAS